MQIIWCLLVLVKQVLTRSRIVGTAGIHFLFTKQSWSEESEETIPFSSVLSNIIPVL